MLESALGAGRAWTGGVAMSRRTLAGWSSTERRSPAGAVEFEQLVTSTRPLVAYSEAGARELAERYWREVETATRRLVRARHREGAVALLLFGRWTLLRFEAPRTVVDESGVLTSFAITGGLLVRTPGGSITFSQSAQPRVQLRATIDGFFPRLGRRQEGPAWTGGLYRHVQQRIHTAISRRYFARLIDEEAA
ncbi:MAG: hypothetical protein QOI71_109 [Gaiellales bacterium]|nr:hypothetical protein [Gaiellales bacterium]